MPQRNDLAAELVAALSDKRVHDALGQIFEDRMQWMINKIDELQRENKQQNEEIDKLKTDLKTAYSKIDDLEAYNRRDNLIIAGLPVVSYAEAASSTTGESAAGQPTENMKTTEASVLALCQQLQVPITPSDISIAHRLQKRNDDEPPAVIVRFTSRKARDSVYAARFQLKNRKDNTIFINEDLTKTTAKLFAQARKLVKNKVIFSTWTKIGTVYIKREDTPTCRPTRILSVEDLFSPPQQNE